MCVTTVPKSAQTVASSCFYLTFFISRVLIISNHIAVKMWRPRYWSQHQVRGDIILKKWALGNSWQPRYFNIFVDLQVIKNKGNFPQQPIGFESHLSAFRVGKLTSERQWGAKEGRGEKNLGTRVKSNQQLTNTDCCKTYKTQSHANGIPVNLW